MLFEMLRSGLSFPEIIINVLYFGLAMVIVLPVHECAHAYIAYKLGDTSQKVQGRLTLNPLKHLDPLGALSILLTGFGWAKPVYVNGSLINRGGRFASGWISLAGPASNLLLGVLFAFILGFIERFVVTVTTFIIVIENFLEIVVILSINLAVFNLIPIPPLDGFGIIRPFLPERVLIFVNKYRMVIYIVFIVLLVTGALSTPMSNVSQALRNLIWKLVDVVLW